jgi:hypothetical protein
VTIVLLIVSLAVFIAADQLKKATHERAPDPDQVPRFWK